MKTKRCSARGGSRGKNPRQGESLDKDKTDRTTTNKQNPQDTPAGRWTYTIISDQCMVNIGDHGPEFQPSLPGLNLLCLARVFLKSQLKPKGKEANQSTALMRPCWNFMTLRQIASVSSFEQGTHAVVVFSKSATYLHGSHHFRSNIT